MKTKFYFTIIFFTLTFISKAQWVKVHTKEAKCFTSSGTTLIAGTTSSIDISTDEGVTWITKLTTAGGFVNSIISSGDKVFAGTFVGANGGGIYLSNDQGKTWTPVNNGLPKSDFIYSLAIKGSKIFAGTQSNGLYMSSNDGTTWTNITAPTLTGKLIQSLLVDNNSLYAGTENGVFLSTDEGSTWSNIGLTGNVTLALKIQGSSLYASVRNKGIYISKNNGASWVNINQGLPTTVECHNFIFSGNAIFINAGGKIYISIDEGADWNSVSEGIFTNSEITSIHKHNLKLYAGSTDVNGNNTPNYVAIWSRLLSQMTTGINNYDLLELNIFPNPTRNQITIDCGDYNNINGYQIKIVNTLSQTVYQQVVNSKLYTIDLKALGNKGLYFVNVYDAQGNLMSVKKIVLQ